MINGQRTQILIPNAVTWPAPLVVYHHGYSEDQTGPQIDALKSQVMAALLGAGYLVASSNEHSPGWGGPNVVADVVGLYNFVVTNYAVSRTVHLSQSMGGVGINTHLVPAIPSQGWAGIFPAINMGAMHGGTGGANFDADINAAYGCTDVTYPVASAGYDPMLQPINAWQGRRLRFYASPGDAVVLKTVNADLLSARAVAGGAAEAVVVACTGNHGDPSHFQPADLLAFFNRCV